MLAAFDAAEAAIAPVYTMADVLAILTSPSATRSSRSTASGCRRRWRGSARTPGHIRHAGRPLGTDTDDVLAALDDPAAPDGPWGAGGG